jgi:hypothetical protein
VHRVSEVVRHVASNLHGAQKALIISGGLAATLIGGAALSTPVQARGAELSYHPGYRVEGSWLCYGWANGSYHCTQHWHTSHGSVVSDNTAWVPNYGAAAPSAPTHATTHTSHVSNASKRSTSVHHTTTAPSYGAANPGTQGVINEIRAVFGPYAGSALAVARCESGYNASAYNRTSVSGAHAAGVFQILDSSTWRSTSYANQSPFNASANIHAAYQIFQRDGYSWREWQCKP